jgi:carboxymethylenebutenolidase
MGKEIEFGGIRGYLAEPSGTAPGVIVLHEWWGLNSPMSNIQEIADKLAEAGLIALAPDLYGGKTADNPDDAGKLMMDMFQNRMSEVNSIILESVKYLKSLNNLQPKKVGITGFCCGGTLSMYAASKFGNEISASVPFYGLPQLMEIDFSSIKMPIFFILSQNDEFVDNDQVIELSKSVWKNGVEMQIKVYPGVNHAFLNSKRPDVYNEELAADALKMCVDFFKRHLT